MLIRRMPASLTPAEETLAEAEVRLYQAKFDALLGERFDTEEYDTIVLAYREAKRRADLARWSALQASSGTPAPRSMAA